MYKLSGKADDSTEAMENVLDSIVHSPLLGWEYPEIDENIHRVDYRLHAIFYRKREKNIFILRILHQKMEPLLHFSDTE